MLGIASAISLGMSGAAGGGASAPAIPTLTAPGASTHYPNEGVTVSATSTDGDLDRIDWVLDPGGSEVVVATDATAPYSTTWTVSPSLALGAHTLVARAVRGGDSTDSTPVAITLWHPSVLTECIEFWDASFSADFTLATADVISWAGRKATYPLTDLGNSAQRPSILTAELNGHDVVQFNGTTDWLEAASLDRPSPATENTFYYAIARYDAYSSFDALLAGGTASTGNITIAASATGPLRLNQNNGAGVNANSGLSTTGTWGRIHALFAGGTNTDSLTIKGTTVGPATAGNTNPGSGICMGSSAGLAATFAAVSVAAAGVFNAQPSGPNLALLDAWTTAMWGAGLVS